MFSTCNSVAAFWCTFVFLIFLGILLLTLMVYNSTTVQTVSHALRVKWNPWRAALLTRSTKIAIVTYWRRQSISQKLCNPHVLGDYRTLLGKSHITRCESLCAPTTKIVFWCLLTCLWQLVYYPQLYIVSLARRKLGIRECCKQHPSLNECWWWLRETRWFSWLGSVHAFPPVLWHVVGWLSRRASGL